MTDQEIKTLLKVECGCEIKKDESLGIFGQFYSYCSVHQKVSDLEIYGYMNRMWQLYRDGESRNEEESAYYKKEVKRVREKILGDSQIPPMLSGFGDCFPMSSTTIH